MTTPSSTIESRKVHVDESIGSDTVGNGALDKPYQTAAYAIFANEHSQSLNILVRSKPESDYTEISPSGLKKAKKNAEGLAKKARKAEEQRLKEEQEKGAEAERLRRKLEESKQITLKEDLTLPSPVKVILSHYSLFTIRTRYPHSPGKNCKLRASPIEACQCIWMGTPLARPEGSDLC
jgi:Asparaginal-tRNA synthetase, N-terminal domain